jgi:hypothetical protein
MTRLYMEDTGKRIELQTAMKRTVQRAIQYLHKADAPFKQVQGHVVVCYARSHSYGNFREVDDV